MSDSIVRILEELPTSSLTTRVLSTLDYVVPGTWQNVTNFEAMIADETGESDPAVIQAVGEKAIALYMDPETGFQRGLTIYKLVDSGATMAGLASLAGKLGEDVGWLSFLGSITPKPETAQAIDAALKFAAEIAAFAATNGLPGDGIAEFASAFVQSAKEDKMRLAAWVAFDCILPLGPDYLAKLLGALDGGIDRLRESTLFSKIEQHLPGGDLDAKRDFVKRALEEAAPATHALAATDGLTQEGILAKVAGYLEGAEGKLDYAASILDLSTNVFEHTGTQTVARRCIARAYGEI